MISPPALTDANWSSGSILTGSSNSTASAFGDNPVAGVDSFQSVFAQVSAPTSTFTAVSGSVGDLPWKSVPQPSSVSEPAESGTENSSTSQVSQSPVNQSKTGPTGWLISSERSNSKLSARTAQPRGGRSESQNHAPPASDPADGGSASSDSNSATNPTDTVAKNAASNAAAPKMSSSSDPASLPAGAAAALGGVKALAGAAFALHVTPASASGHNGQATADQGSQGSNANPGNPTQSNDGGSFASALASNDNPLLASAVPSAHVALENLTNPAGTALPSGSAWQNQTSASPAQVQSDAPAAVVSSFETSEVTDETGTAPQTLRTLQVQLGSDSEGRVDLRLVEHAGGLSVSVRASDSTLTKGLQDNLPDLSARLAAEKYQTHAFVPMLSEPSGGLASGSSEHSSPDSQKQDNGRSSSQNGGESSGRQPGGQAQQQFQQQPENQNGAAWWRQIAALGKLSSPSFSDSAQGVSPQQGATSQVNQSPTPISLS